IAKQNDILPRSFPDFDYKIAARWFKSGDLEDSDLRYMGFVQSTFGIPTDSDDSYLFCRLFSYENTKTGKVAAAKSAIFANSKSSESNSLGSDEKGYFANFFSKLLIATKIDPEELAIRMEVFPAYIEACLEGEIVPLGKPL